MKTNSLTKILSAAAVVALLSTSSSVFAQVKIGSNPATIGSSSNLEVEATNGKKVMVDKTTGATTVQSLSAAAATDSIVTANQAGMLDQISMSRLAQILKTTYGLGGGSATGSTQTMRFGINAQTLPGSSSYVALRFNQANSAAEMGTNNFGGQNFINTITGATFQENVALPAGAGGTLARTTDRVTLPAGTYKISLKIQGRFQSNNVANYVAVQVTVDNTLYEWLTVSNEDTGELSGNYVSTIVELSESKAIDFLAWIQTSSYAFENPASGAASPKIYSELITIEKLL